MLNEQHNLYHVSYPEMLSIIKEMFPNAHYDWEKHLLVIDNESHQTIGYIRLPLHVAVSDDLVVRKEDSTTIYISIEADYAAIHVQEGLENVYHTTDTSYMTRKKRGYSQVKYLNKKGKSRAGSRVRLAKTIEFFENINTKLSKLFEEYQFDRIGIYCSPSLISLLHESKVACPFDKNDERLYKIPLHIPQSNHENLRSVIKKLKAPILFYDKKGIDDLKPVLDL